jgi:hypothetical protein
MKSKIKIHDRIVGAIILSTVLLGVRVNPLWLWVPGVISALMVASAFTGLCPVYFVLNRLIPGEP